MSLNLLQEVQMQIGDESYRERRNSFKYHKLTDRMYVLVTLTDHHLLVAAMLIVVVHYNVKKTVDGNYMMLNGVRYYVMVLIDSLILQGLVNT